MVCKGEGTLNYNFRITATTCAGNTREISPVIDDTGNTVTLTVPVRMLCEPRLEKLIIESSITTAHAGDPGYMFFPTNFYCGFVLCRFVKRENVLFKTWPTAMTVCGICENDNAVFVHILGEAHDARFYVEHKDGTYSVSPEFRFDGDIPDEDIVVIYKKMPGASYSDMARVYRKYQIDYKGCVPLRERVKQREALRLAADCMELRIRMGWKPIPTPVRHQTIENEPPMIIACNVERLNKIVDKMYAAGIKHAEICLVGWGAGGHDGRFPQQYPSDERYGGDDKLREFIAKVQHMGYLVVCHTVSCGAYEIADNFDRDLLTKKRGPEGDPIPYLRDHYKKDGLNGGDPWHLCAKTAYENYAVKDLPVVRGYGFWGLHYIDELTAVIPEKCCDKNHPVSRKTAWEYYRKLALLARSLFGGYQSEGYMDYMNDCVDAVLYTGVESMPCHRHNPLFDEGIPFWQLVYHGIVMSNPTSQTVNYTIKDEKQHLKFIEYGGRPLMYFYSKFGDDRNWMGDLDLHCADDSETDKSVEAIKKAYDEYEKYKYLQYEFMDSHNKLSEGVYRTVYSDGTTVTVDYNSNSISVNKPNAE